MQATIGDHICIHGNVVGHPDKNGEILEVHGSQGEPPYLVKFDDGHTRLIFPGPDAVIEHPELRFSRGDLAGWELRRIAQGLAWSSRDG